MKLLVILLKVKPNECEINNILLEVKIDECDMTMTIFVTMQIHSRLRRDNINVPSLEG